MDEQRIVDTAVAVLAAGQPVVLPTDTVYGLCASPYRAEPVRKLAKLKRRDERQPIALVAADVDMLLECVPELRGRAGTYARALLPGPLTLVMPNPGRRFAWLAESRPETIGVRVPELEGAARSVLDRVGAVAATSANISGGPDPKSLDEVPAEILEACGAVVDGGELPGTPSTVIDLTTPEPQVLREGAVSAEEVLQRLAPLLAT
jgi:L-threonylcarbamoyladenylate synthase